jgi:hypothetical protein
MLMQEFRIWKESVDQNIDQERKGCTIIRKIGRHMSYLSKC